ncbi:MAG: hypothetical protein ACI8WB_006142, partial [Phenylobacterium sp.]
DTLLVAMAVQLIELTSAQQLNPKFLDEINQWGKTLVNALSKDGTQASVKGSAWLTYFKAQLKSRNDREIGEKTSLEPKILDLINLLNRMAQDLKNKTSKNLLVMIDDLEKGSSDAEKLMHQRLFSEYNSVLTQLHFNIIYTLPVYFKAMPNSRIDKESIFSFSAQRMYTSQDKKSNIPPLDKNSTGYQFMTKFILQRLHKDVELFEEGVLDELMRIGGGLFRDTDAAIENAAYFAIERDAEKVAMQDAEKVFNRLKASYQPFIRGKAITVLGEVADSEGGWVTDVEPFLQSRAVIEYENGDIWLDVRYVLKAYVRSLFDKI